MVAYAYPCRRFASALAGSDARLGASVDRYPFTAVDFHHLLPAGLPAHRDAACGGSSGQAALLSMRYVIGGINELSSS